MDKINIKLLVIGVLSFLCMFGSVQADDTYYDNEYLVWALGEDYMSLKLWEIDDVWNERHGDIFLLDGTEIPTEALDRMIEVGKIKRN